MNRLNSQKNAPLVEAARAVSPVPRRNADDAERETRLTPEATQALLTAGMFRLGTPRRPGVHELRYWRDLETAPRQPTH